MLRNVILLAALCLLGSSSAWAADQNPVEIAGTWAVTSLDPQGSQTRIMTIHQNAGKFAGTLKFQQIVSPVEGTVDGTKVSFTSKLRTSHGEVAVTFTGTVAGDSMSGTSKVGDADVSWSAVKLPSEPRPHK